MKAIFNRYKNAPRGGVLRGEAMHIETTMGSVFISTGRLRGQVLIELPVPRHADIAGFLRALKEGGYTAGVDHNPKVTNDETTLVHIEGRSFDNVATLIQEQFGQAR